MPCSLCTTCVLQSVELGSVSKPLALGLSVAAALFGTHLPGQLPTLHTTACLLGASLVTKALLTLASPLQAQAQWLCE